MRLFSVLSLLHLQSVCHSYRLIPLTCEGVCDQNPQNEHVRSNHKQNQLGIHVFMGVQILLSGNDARVQGLQAIQQNVKMSNTFWLVDWSQQISPEIPLIFRVIDCMKSLECNHILWCAPKSKDWWSQPHALATPYLFMKWKGDYPTFLDDGFHCGCRLSVTDITIVPIS